MVITKSVREARNWGPHLEGTSLMNVNGTICIDRSCLSPESKTCIACVENHRRETRYVSRWNDSQGFYLATKRELAFEFDCLDKALDSELDFSLTSDDFFILRDSNLKKG